MRRAIHSVLLVASLIVLFLAGCEPVDGLDLNQVLTKGYTEIESGEAAGTLSVDFSYDEAFMDARTKKILDLFDGARLEFHSVAKDALTAAMDGKLNLKAGEIPFRITADLAASKLALFLNNDLSKPILLQDIAPESGTDAERSLQLQKAFITSFVKHLPNPERIAVQSVTETIHHETIPVKQVHVELYGPEVKDFLLALVENLLKDSEGMAQLIHDIAVNAGDEGLGGEEADPDAIREELESMLEGIKENADLIQSLLDENTYFKADLYVDSQLFPRKEAYAIGFALPNQSFGFKLQAESENWNLNKKDLEFAPIESDQYLTELSTEQEFLDSLNKKGTLYHILKNELNLFRKEIQLTIGKKEAVNNGELVELDAAPYISGNRALVPLRFVSESLGADLLWDNERREIIVRDSSKEIILKPGSDRAVVNGKPVALDVKVEIVNGRSFVPLRFLSETLGYELEWNGQLKMITLAKDAE